jgi:hypothetical protein
MMVKHLRIPGPAHLLSHFCLAWAQLATGVGFPILEFPSFALPTLEDELLVAIRAGMTKLTASIRLHNNQVHPLAREGDFYIIEGLIALDVLSPAELLRVNYCRLYLQVYQASDVVSPDGATLHKGLFSGTLQHRPHVPSGIFPRQARPDTSSWIQWRRALRLLFTAPYSTNLALLSPLGPWRPLQSTSPKWFWYRASNSIVSRSRRTDALTQYPLKFVGRRLTAFSKLVGTPVDQVPPLSVPISPPAVSSREPQSSSHPASASVASLVRRTSSPPRSSASSISLPEIFALIQVSSTLTLVDDGGAKTCRGSFAAVAALDSIRILHLKGPVAGPDPRLYRAEAYAMAAIVLCVVVLYDALPVPPSSYAALDLFSDNEGLIKKVNAMIQWEHHYPSNALLSEWDILSVILEYIPRLPMPPTIKHVLGHEDKDAPISTLPLAAQLNCEADALATSALKAIPSPIPQAAVFPTVMCQLDVGDATASRHLTSTLHYACGPRDDRVSPRAQQLGR